MTVVLQTTPPPSKSVENQTKKCFILGRQKEINVKIIHNTGILSTLSKEPDLDKEFIYIIVKRVDMVLLIGKNRSSQVQRFLYRNGKQCQTENLPSRS